MRSNQTVEEQTCHRSSAVKKTHTSQILLILTGIELIFSIVAIMVLCFGFVLETALITQGCFSYCSACTAPFLFLAIPHQ